MSSNLLRGLWHLAGETVAVVVNGAVLPDQTVSSEGEIELPDALEDEDVVIVGLRYNQDLVTLPLGWEGLEALAQSFEKNLTKAYVRVHNAVTVYAGPTFDQLRPYPERSDEDWGSPPDLKTGYIEIPLDGDWNVEGKVSIRNSDPTPCTITGLVLEVEA